MRTEPDSRRKPTILVIMPDYKQDYRVLKQILPESQYSFVKADSPRQAEKYITRKAFRVDVVICETNLPEGDWRDVLRVTQDNPYKPKLVLCSRHADDQLWAEALNVGAYDVLIKPFWPEEVSRVIQLATFPVQTMRAH